MLYYIIVILAQTEHKHFAFHLCSLDVNSTLVFIFNVCSDATLYVSFLQVARRIQMSGPQLCLLLLSSDEYEQAVAQGWNLKELCKAQRGEEWNPPRFCHIIRNPVSGLGLSIHPVEGE